MYQNSNRRRLMLNTYRAKRIRFAIIHQEKDKKNNEFKNIF